MKRHMKRCLLLVPFAVTLEGVLDFAPSLDQCVSGRGTQRLTVTCSRTQPYGGQRDY